LSLSFPPGFCGLLYFVLSIQVAATILARTMPRVLAAFAHPDDIEFLCAGTLRLLVEEGWELQCVTLCGGDMGAPSGTREAIRARRLEEAAAGAVALGGTYGWAGMNDLEVYYCPEQVRQVTEVLRRFSPELVITHSPRCYMIDHEETAKLVRMAVFAMAIPLFPAVSPATGRGVPALYYADALEGKDQFGDPVRADFWIDVTSSFPDRQRALACHESQREWLRSHHGVDDYLANNEKLARQHGALAGCALAEGFRQHLGHGYPQENVLANSLREFVRGGGRR
jgi:LmbE family N-acetylglucosaminyl deacetylase